jgi:transcriptional regulator with XRE-family HTH domain
MPEAGRRDDFEGIGERIRRFREDAHLSLSALATKADVSKGYLHRLEAGTNDVRPSGNTLYALAEALGVTMSDLLGRRLLVAARGEVPKALQEFADEEGLPETDVVMLSSIEFRGEAPRTKERWRYIYNAIETSRGLDRPRRRGEPRETS